MSKKKRGRVVGTTRQGLGNVRVDHYDDGSQVVRMDETTVAIMKAQRAAFEEKFGRPPAEDDPVFFDPDHDIPTPLTAEKVRRVVLDAATKAGYTTEEAFELWERLA